MGPRCVEYYPPPHCSFIPLHSCPLWQPSLAAVLATVTEPIKYRELMRCQNSPASVLSIRFVLTYLSLKFMNEPPSLLIKAQGRVPVWKVIFFFVMKIGSQTLGAVSLLIGVSKNKDTGKCLRTAGNSR